MKNQNCSSTESLHSDIFVIKVWSQWGESFVSVVKRMVKSVNLFSFVYPQAAKMNRWNKSCIGAYDSFFENLFSNSFCPSRNIIILEREPYAMSLLYQFIFFLSNAIVPFCAMCLSFELYFTQFAWLCTVYTCIRWNVMANLN